MNTITTIGLTLVLLAVLVSCASVGGGGVAVSDIEAKEAFAISYASVLIEVFAAAFGPAGQEVEGVVVDSETEELTFDKYDLSEYMRDGDADAGADTSYKTVSGTAVFDDAALTVDLILEGGPVKSIEFTLGQAKMMSEDGFTFTAKINGREMELEIGPDDLWVM